MTSGSSSREQTPNAAPCSELAHASAFLEQGDVSTAREYAQRALAVAQAERELPLEAHALLCLASCDRRTGRYRRCLDASRRAARVFSLTRDISHEALAHASIAQASAFMGFDQQAVEAGLLSVRLAEFGNSPETIATAYNYLGVAYTWAREYAAADHALERAIQAADGPTLRRQGLHPALNFVLVEVLRTAMARYAQEGGHSTAALEQRLAAVQPCLDLNGGKTLFPGGHDEVRVMSHFAEALLAAWQRQSKIGMRALAKATAHLTGSPLRPVFEAFAQWVAAELAWAEEDHVRAAGHALEMTHLASDAEHEQLACLGHLVLSSIRSAQGNDAEALRELQRLRLRSLRIRSEELRYSVQVVEWQLENRQFADRVELLQQQSHLLTKLSFEDALTGLNNRRRFDEELERQIANRGDDSPALCLAIFDINDFKRINDEFTHAAGDDVLKGVADVLRNIVRGTDLAARFAGDEFVVLFPQTSLDVAEAVCRRVADAVLMRSWPHLARQLSVSVSFGCALALPSDGPTTLLRRADHGMYRQKSVRNARPVETP